MPKNVMSTTTAASISPDPNPDDIPKTLKNMKPDNHQHYWKALGLGVIAGMRSLAAPALLSQELSRVNPELLKASPLRFLQAGPVATGLKLLATAELAGDKLPRIPDRTALPSLVVRTTSGALVGAALFMASQDKPLKGAVIGGMAALAGTYGSFYLRRALSKYGKVSNIVSGVMEDAVLLSSGLAMVKK
jgi:uncharacterized membrane protein